MAIFGAHELHSWGRYTCASSEFFVENLTLNNFYLKHFFHMIRIFGSTEPYSESTFRFNIHYNISNTAIFGAL